MGTGTGERTFNDFPVKRDFFLKFKRKKPLDGDVMSFHT